MVVYRASNPAPACDTGLDALEGFEAIFRLEDPEVRRKFEVAGARASVYTPHNLDQLPSTNPAKTATRVIIPAQPLRPPARMEILSNISKIKSMA